MCVSARETGPESPLFVTRASIDLLRVCSAICMR